VFVSDVGSLLSMAIAKLLVLYFVEELFQHTHVHAQTHTDLSLS
jgi:hypothetical protein